MIKIRHNIWKYITIYCFITGKEARKKELKKNKRQRQMVRAAVLKMKDPTQILEELQKIDEMGIFFGNSMFILFIYLL